MTEDGRSGRTGRVVIVGVDESGAAAAALVRDGAALVVAGADAALVGSRVAELRAAGARAAGWVGAPTDAGAAEMAVEVFPDCRLTDRQSGAGAG